MITIAKVGVFARVQPPEMTIIRWPLEEDVEEDVGNISKYLEYGIYELSCQLPDKEEVVIKIEGNVLTTNKARYACVYTAWLDEHTLMEYRNGEPNINEN